MNKYYKEEKIEYSHLHTDYYNDEEKTELTITLEDECIDFIKSNNIIEMSFYCVENDDDSCDAEYGANDLNGEMGDNFKCSALTGTLSDPSTYDRFECELNEDQILFLAKYFGAC